ncbi:MAG: proline--tRNA ligase [Deltaproteobacteria bacterium]|nr:proline--tRNA ligase [Deltaproteobacteria bacterium]
MRFSRFFIPTLRETPGEAETVSHQLMLRAAMIRPVASGVFTLLPLGLRALRKIEVIVRQEMDRAGCSELLMPALQPKELWEESGRWAEMGKELIRFTDRKEREFCLGPTHEEIVTDLARHEIRSYRQLPLILYQIQVKFRDEIRPRFGLMRGREFIMKDAYSFDISKEKALESYELMRQVYCRIFERCGLNFRMVEARTGAIGGKLSHEFQVLAASGEDTLLTCDRCHYSANIELAEVRRPDAEEPKQQKRIPEIELVETPGLSSVEEVSAFFRIATNQLIKTLIVTDGREYSVVLIRGDRQLNEFKLQQYLGWKRIEMASPEKIKETTGGDVGFSGPVHLSLRMAADWDILEMGPAIVGANQRGKHFKNALQGRDFHISEFSDLRMAQNGDRCARCKDAKGVLKEYRGIEVGHIFYLDIKYSKAFQAAFLSADGKEQSLEMGCYGIGIGRTMAAAIEQNHDERGIVWPLPIAPFQVIITELGARENKRVAEVSTGLYEAMQSARIEVLYDDRDERAGVKFSDADLIGVPIRVTVSVRGISQNQVELKWRNRQDVEMMPVEQVVPYLKELLAKRGLILL